MVAKRANGVYDLAELEVGNYAWHNLALLGQQPIHCAIHTETEDADYNWQNIFNLRLFSKTPKLAAVLEAIDGQIHRIPYLGNG
jgi:hypothetical protein